MFVSTDFRRNKYTLVYFSILARSSHAGLRLKVYQFPFLELIFSENDLVIEGQKMSRERTHHILYVRLYIYIFAHLKFFNEFFCLFLFSF